MPGIASTTLHYGKLYQELSTHLVHLGWKKEYIVQDPVSPLFCFFFFPPHDYDSLENWVPDNYAKAHVKKKKKNNHTTSKKKKRKKQHYEYQR